jgi:integrase
VGDAIDKHAADHGTTSDGYLFQGRKYKLIVRRAYQEDFQRSAARVGLPPEFISHPLRHYYASSALAEGISITDVSRWLGHKSIEVTHQIASEAVRPVPIEGRGAAVLFGRLVPGAARPDEIEHLRPGPSERS